MNSAFGSQRILDFTDDEIMETVKDIPIIDLNYDQGVLRCYKK